MGAGWSQPRAGPASRGDPQAPQQLRGEQGTLPDFHPACSVFHIPSCCRLAGAEDRATPPSRRGDVHNTASLLRSSPLRHPDPERKTPVGRAAGQYSRASPSPAKSHSPNAPFPSSPQPKVGSLKGHVSPAKAPPPAPLQLPGSQGGLPPLSVSPVSSQFFFSEATNTFL